MNNAELAAHQWNIGLPDRVSQTSPWFRDTHRPGRPGREVSSPDNGSEFRSRYFGQAAARHGATQRWIKAGRSNSNGCAERLQLTILEECWRPAFSRSLAPKLTALERDLEEYLDYYG